MISSSFFLVMSSVASRRPFFFTGERRKGERRKGASRRDATWITPCKAAQRSQLGGGNVREGKPARRTGGEKGENDVPRGTKRQTIEHGFLDNRQNM